MVSRDVIKGCCASSNYYNLGGAHGVANVKDQDEFDRQSIIRHSPETLNIAICNSFQTVAMGYLRTQGWTETKYGNLTLFHASGKTLRNYLHSKNNRKKLGDSFKGGIVHGYIISIFMGTSSLTKKSKEEIEKYFSITLGDHLLGKYSNSIHPAVVAAVRKKNDRKTSIL